MRKIFIGLLAMGFLLVTAYTPLYASSSSATTPSGIPISELDNFVDSYVNGYIDKTTLGASVVIMKDNAIVHVEGYGHTDDTKQIKVDAASTVFEWGSISKLFVWVSALQLVEQGTLDLNAPLSNYLSKDQMPKLQYDEPITMLHLMNHNAGFEEYIINLIGDSKEDVEPLDVALKHSQPYQAYQPGEVVSYSNYSTSLAALVIESITGQSFDTYLQDHIFAPLEMNDTIVTIANDEALSKIENKRATGYVSLKDRSFIEMPFSYLSLYPSGSLNGPATDLAKFTQALLAKTDADNKLFNSLSTLDLLFTTTHTEDSSIAGIAHGFWEFNGVYKSFAHGGNTTGFATNLHIVPDADFSVVILTNQVSELDITYGLVEALLDGDSSSINHERLPLSNDLNYNESFVPARNTNHTFTKLFFHIAPITISPNYDEQLIELNLGGGLTAQFEQIVPNGFRLVEGPPVALIFKEIYLHTDGSSITQISAPYNDYLASNISPVIIIVSLGLLILLALYSLVFAIIYLVKVLLHRVPLVAHSIVLFLQVVTLINLAVLALRMLSNSLRNKAELIIHFYLNYGILALTAILLIYMTYRCYKNKTLLTYSYISTVVVVVLYQAIVIFWRFYSI